MQQIAEKAGVSRTTVSFVLNNTPHVNIPAETRERVWNAARELNYVPAFAAQSLATGRSNTLAFIVRVAPERLATELLFLGGVLNGIAAAIYPHGYHLLFYAMAPDASHTLYAELVRSQRVDGFLISGSAPEDDAVLKAFFQEGTPMVVHGSPTFAEIPSVDVDNLTSAKSAVEHLVQQGHERIACITNGPPDHEEAQQRLSGYQQAMQEAGLPWDQDLVRYGDYTGESGYVEMATLLEQSKPLSAVFVCSDVVALGAIKALRERQLRVPEDISVVGFDDIPLVSYFEPGLTTVRLPTTDLGFYAGDMLLQLLRGEIPEKTRVILGTELIVRGSTASLLHGGQPRDLPA